MWLWTTWISSNLLFLIIESEFNLSLCVVAPQCRCHETTLQVKLEDDNYLFMKVSGIVASTGGHCIQQKGWKSLTTDFEPRLTQIEDFQGSCIKLYLNNSLFNMNRFVWCFGLRVNPSNLFGFSLRNELNLSLYVWLRPSVGPMRQPCKCEAGGR